MANNKAAKPKQDTIQGPVFERSESTPQKTEAQLIDEAIAAIRQFNRDHEKKRPVAQQISQLVAADADGNGIIDPTEFRRYLSSSATPEVRALVQKIECGKPEESAMAKAMAGSYTDSLRRSLEMLKRRQPGYGAETLARNEVAKMVSLVEQMLDAQGSDQPGVSPVGAKKLAEFVQQTIVQDDTKALAAYDGMVKRNELGKLPTQALPLTATDFCAAYKR